MTVLHGLCGTVLLLPWEKRSAAVGILLPAEKTAGAPGREALAGMLYRIKIDGRNVRQMKIFLPDFLKYSYKRIDFHEFL